MRNLLFPRQPRMQRRDVIQGGQRLPVHVLEPRRGVPGDPPGILFLHGFGRSPRHYRRFLRTLAHETGARIAAPFLYGNGWLPRPPQSLADCVELTHRVVEELARAGELGRYVVLGHSTGATVALQLAAAKPAPEAIVALCPVLPVRYGPLGFVRRSLRVASRQLSGVTATPGVALGLQLRTGAGLWGALLRRPGASLRLIRDLSRFQLRDVRLHYDRIGARGRMFEQPARVVLAPHDELFEPPSDLVAWLRLAYGELQVRVLSDVSGHDWPLVHGEHTARRLAPHMAGRAAAGGAVPAARRAV